MSSNLIADTEAADIAIGRRIRVQRKLLGVSQTTLAEKVGCSYQSIQKYESGGVRISGVMLLRLAIALDCRVAVLLGEVDACPVQENRIGQCLAQPEMASMVRRLAEMAREKRTPIMAAFSEALEAVA